MIGVIGPEDSGALVREIAAEEGRSDETMVRTYQRLEEAAEIASAMETVCDLILFTGVVPYRYAHDKLTLSIPSQYIQHSAEDLYRLLCRILIEREGVMPRVTIDTVDSSVVTASFRDVGLDEPALSMPVDKHGKYAEGPTEAVAAAHLAAIERGAATAGITCLASVKQALDARGVPVWRVVHARGTVRAALQNAWMAAQLARSNSGQIAIALIQLDQAAFSRLGSYESELARLRAHETLLELAKNVGGGLSRTDESLFVITTSRGSVERAIERDRAGLGSLLTPVGLGVEATVGIGIGANYALAEENARQAIKLTALQTSTNVVFPDGAIYASNGEGGSGSRSLKETNSGVLELSALLGLGPMTIRRVVDALKALDHESVTTQQLASTYGIQQRSARRMLSALVAADLASIVGIVTGPGRGRPQSVYSINLTDLISILGPPSIDPSL